MAAVAPVKREVGMIEHEDGKRLDHGRKTVQKDVLVLVQAKLMKRCERLS